MTALGVTSAAEYAQAIDDLFSDVKAGRVEAVVGEWTVIRFSNMWMAHQPHVSTSAATPAELALLMERWDLGGSAQERRA